MMLYRIMSNEEWVISQREGKVPRCSSDRRDNCIHLNKYEDIVRVTNEYFIKEEEPVVIEINCANLTGKVEWQLPTKAKPWNQPNIDQENIMVDTITRFCHLIYNDQKRTFELPDAF